MKYITLEGKFGCYYHYHFALLNHFRHKVLFNLSFYLLLTLESFVKVSKSMHEINLAIIAIPLHQGLILHLFHFHLALCLPKPIRAYLVEEANDDSDNNIPLSIKYGSLGKSKAISPTMKDPLGPIGASLNPKALFAKNPISRSHMKKGSKTPLDSQKHNPTL